MAYDGKVEQYLAPAATPAQPWLAQPYKQRLEKLLEVMDECVVKGYVDTPDGPRRLNMLVVDNFGQACAVGICRLLPWFREQGLRRYGEGHPGGGHYEFFGLPSLVTNALFTGGFGLQPQAVRAAVATLLRGQVPSYSPEREEYVKAVLARRAQALFAQLERPLQQPPRTAWNRLQAVFA